MKTAELKEKKKKRKPVKSIFSNIVRVPWDEPFRKPRSEQISECRSSFIEAYYLVCKWNKRHSFTNAEIMRVSDF